MNKNKCGGTFLLPFVVTSGELFLMTLRVSSHHRVGVKKQLSKGSSDKTLKPHIAPEGVT